MRLLITPIFVIMLGSTSVCENTSDLILERLNDSAFLVEQSSNDGIFSKDDLFERLINPSKLRELLGWHHLKISQEPSSLHKRESRLASTTKKHRAKLLEIKDHFRTLYLGNSSDEDYLSRLRKRQALEEPYQYYSRRDYSANDTNHTAFSRILNPTSPRGDNEFITVQPVHIFTGSNESNYTTLSSSGHTDREENETPTSWPEPVGKTILVTTLPDRDGEEILAKSLRSYEEEGTSSLPDDGKKVVFILSPDNKQKALSFSSSNTEEESISATIPETSLKPDAEHFTNLPAEFESHVTYPNARTDIAIDDIRHSQGFSTNIYTEGGTSANGRDFKTTTKNITIFSASSKPVVSTNVAPWGYRSDVTESVSIFTSKGSDKLDKENIKPIQRLNKSEGFIFPTTNKLAKNFPVSRFFGLMDDSSTRKIEVTSSNTTGIVPTSNNPNIDEVKILPVVHREYTVLLVGIVLCCMGVVFTVGGLVLFCTHRRKTASSNAVELRSTNYNDQMRQYEFDPSQQGV